MLAVIAGIILIIDGVLTWTGTITLAHSIAVLEGVIGILFALSYFIPTHYYRRNIP